MKIKQIQRTLVIIFLAILPNLATADFSIIVHPSNVQTLEAKEIERIFMGKSKSLKPYTLANEDIKTEFNRTVINKSNSQMKAYWSRLTFTGKGIPPKSLSASEMIDIIASSPNSIGYIDTDSVTDQVKVVSY